MLQSTILHGTFYFCKCLVCGLTDVRPDGHRAISITCRHPSIWPHLSQVPATKHTHLIERSLVGALIPTAEHVVLLRVQVAPDVSVVSQQAAAGTAQHVNTGEDRPRPGTMQHTAGKAMRQVSQQARGQAREQDRPRPGDVQDTGGESCSRLWGRHGSRQGSRQGSR